jgi:hypothetical protein
MGMWNQLVQNDYMFFFMIAHIESLISIYMMQHICKILF